MYSFEYVRAGSVSDAVARLGSGDAVLLAGGQTLLPTLKQRLAQYGTVVDIRHLDELQGIEVGDGVVTIGAGVRHQAVADSEAVAAAVPALSALAAGIGDPQVRALGTLGGSLANSDPAADYPAAVLGLGATVVTDSREITADDFFVGLFETALREGELIRSVRFPVPKRAAYQKFDQPASRFALTGAFVAETAGGVRVAITGAGENGVFRHAGLESALTAEFSSASARSVAVESAGMIGDIHGRPEYRANLVKVMTARAVEACG